MSAPAARWYRTAYTTIGCAGIAAGACVAVRYLHTGATGIDWYELNGAGIAYPAHHLTRFGL